MTTKIEWVKNSDGTPGVTWSPVTGCSHSGMPGCDNCWARRMATRLKGRCGYPADDPFKVTFHPERLEQPLRWRKPRRVFVCSMGDLFHEDVPDDFIDRVFATIALCPQHTFQQLTKRPERMAAWIKAASIVWPLQNVWLGTSASTQEDLERNWPDLRRTPTVVRFISLEPLLGSIDIRRVYSGNMNESCHTEVDWVIIGAESGPKARPCDPEWIRSVVRQCQQAHVPVFVKQIHLDGNPRRLSKNMAEWPDDLRVREMPKR